MRRDVFQAIADPTRRQIIGLLANSSLNLHSIAEKFAVSRPAISRHIRILTECGLITIRKDGRESLCSADLKPLKEVADWTLQYHASWMDTSNAPEGYPARSPRNRRKKQ